MSPNQFTLALLFTGLAIGQTQDRTFYLSHPATNADSTSLVTTIRTITAVQNVSADQAHNAIVASGLTPAARKASARSKTLPGNPSCLVAETQTPAA